MYGYVVSMRCDMYLYQVIVLITSSTRTCFCSNSDSMCTFKKGFFVEVYPM